MKTYQDLLEAKDIPAFIKQAIDNYKGSALYKNAVTGYAYFCKKNTTILQYRKLLYTLSGEAVPDNFSANYKFVNGFFPIFAKQEASYLLGNGVTFQNDKTKEKLGGAKFDNQLYKAGLASIWGAVAYMFFDVDHVAVFKATEFVPLFGEEDGGLHAGIRFWQIADDKPLRATLYEEDGYTEYRYDKDGVQIIKEKSNYIIEYKKSEASGVEIIDGRNYPSFPIVPLWANEEKQTELEGVREKIDGYDLIQSGFANDLDEASQIYWTITNAGGMDDIDLVKFRERMKIVKAAVVDENGSEAQAHTFEVPYNARTAGLEEIKNSLYRDSMSVDMDKISAGSTTATAIRAAYSNLDLKCDGFEVCVTDAINGLLDLIGVEDAPNYKRNRVMNVAEDTQVVLSSAQYLDDETIIKHLPFLSPDEYDGILERKTKEILDRYEDEDEE